MIDPVFGNISFTEASGWEGTYEYPFLGRDVTVRLAFWADDANEPINPSQREALRQFTEHRDALCARAETAIYADYLERLPGLRNQFGSSAEKLMPVIRGKYELDRLVTPTTLFVCEPLLTDDRVIGLLYDCAWEPQLGLAVKIVNEAIEEVGPQDIVL